MASGWTPQGLDESQIADGEAYHRALYLDGDISQPASWHRDSVNHLLNLAIPHINEGSLVVDYGAGTGGSAIELLKALDEQGITIELVLIDPLESWFGKAREILEVLIGSYVLLAKYIPVLLAKYIGTPSKVGE